MHEHHHEVKHVEEKVTVFNQGLRTFMTASGNLVPKGSLSVTVSEAKELLQYPEVLDLAKM